MNQSEEILIELTRDIDDGILVTVRQGATSFSAWSKGTVILRRQDTDDSVWTNEFIHQPEGGTPSLTK